MTDDLLPCPFCGGDADLDWWWNENGDGGRGKVICIDCGTEMAGSDHSRPITAAEKAASKSEAVALWNRRALPAVQPDAREAALREAAAMLTSGAMHGCDNPDEVLECADAILALIDKPAAPHVNETPKSEHDAANVLTPATKGERDD